MKHVSYDIALKLKEKGLERELDPAGNLIGYNLSWKDKSNVSYYHVHTQFPSKEEFLFAPSCQDVLDWFIEKHKIWIHVYHNVEWEFEIVFMDDMEKTTKYQEDYYNKHNPNFPMGEKHSITNIAIGEALTLIS